ncbi:tRNA modification GTPase trmE [Lishizhenia tianjinensis]|uniref:tRNA modification GTPase MnmE n=1 Tax=Lishizhenia tianjinensis TaxID=477690 RepID=A0A1I6YAM7_9FLAO|nr:tRNA uridine-5-carboxymethylaminomethyl(34) synthesis GTPase MnmE [Lishizhenia tianjinensis]SFT47528.1 tRNA modification GTPase trmE [Lishizhenia tianjinensis]
MNSSETICALSTANGMGAIAVIRVSGEEAIAITSSIFSKSLIDAPSHTAHFGTIVNAEGRIIDEVLINVFQGKKSFTGEPTTEIACHGSVFIQQQIIQLLLENGCRMANPGEFSMRAFFNGKMDLSQTEAIADLIASQSSKAHEVAMQQMRGGFSNELKGLREELINFASLVELELDFAEEDVEFADRSQLKALVEKCLKYTNKLASSFSLGNAIKNGFPVAFVGRPNAGKSTLLNGLLQEERAIVSDIPGTTRDTIEETINIEGVSFRLIDTAGIREASDEIERIGIERTHQKIEQANTVVYLFDALNTSVEEVNKDIALLPAAKHLLVVATKNDKIDDATREHITTNIVKREGVELHFIYGKDEQDLEKVKSAIYEISIGDSFDEHSTIVTNARHYDNLIKASSDLEKAKEGLETGITGDFVAMDIRQALYHLGQITGEISTDDLLGNIFANFCIGK